VGFIFRAFLLSTAHARTRCRDMPTQSRQPPVADDSRGPQNAGMAANEMLIIRAVANAIVDFPIRGGEDLNPGRICACAGNEGAACGD